MRNAWLERGLCCLLLTVGVLWLAPARAAMPADAMPVVPQQTDNQLYLPLVVIPPRATDSTVEVLIPAGSFQMGCAANSVESCQPDELPLHTVTLSAYAIDKFEVTNARYKVCVDEGECLAPGLASSRRQASYYGNPAYADYPVLWVNWSQATTFCAWAGKRLPTEAEWEKAARGSSDTRIYPWGDSLPACAKTNYNRGSIVSISYCVGDTSLVGSKAAGASAYGVMDMAGNVAEWVMDWYGGDYYGVSPPSDPQGPATGQFRMLRGGSWGSIGTHVRTASRIERNLPFYWLYDVGFRCARSQ